MQVKREQLGETKVKLTVVADQKILDDVKSESLSHLSRNVRVPGFRPGKAPKNLVEKQIDPSALQSEFLEHAVNHLYGQAVEHEKLRPVSRPEINLTKFVPYNTLEFTAEVEVVGELILPDYQKIKLAKTPVEVTAKDVTGVLDNLLERAATKQEVTRAAKLGDEVTLDFKGTDAKTKEPIDGADGSDYPLMLGSGNFIPGFEEEVIGLKAGGKKDFEITFPKDYATKELQSRKVNFAITAHKVEELAKPKLDDAFASTIGPFKTVAELKADVKKQLKTEREQEQQRAYDNELLEKIAGKTTVAIPASLVDEEVERMEDEEKRNLAYRGQTWQEHLEIEGVNEAQHKEKNRPGAELRVKAGLILGEIADQEKLEITPEELEMRLQLLKGQYQDPAMQAELDKPENRRDIASRMLTEKTLDKLRAYATV